jgi:hypothetical protein
MVSPAYRGNASTVTIRSAAHNGTYARLMWLNISPDMGDRLLMIL